MNIKAVLKKLIDLELSVSAEKGPFDLFALFSTEEEIEGKWDLVVAATWIGEDNKDAVDYLTRQLRSTLTKEEFLTISKIAPLDVYDPRVKDIQKIVITEHNLVELTDYKFYGFWVEKLYVITCKLQIDEWLMYSMWQVIVELWNSGNREIESEEVLARLQAKNVNVRPYAMDRVLEYLMTSGCIRGPQYMHDEDVKAHGAMIITSVDVGCTKVQEEQAKHFCSLIDSLEGLNFAASMQEYYRNDEVKENAWKCVEDISRNPITVELSPSNCIAKVYRELGPDIALKLYRYYITSLSGGPPLNPTVPSFVLSDEEFISMMRQSNLSDAEKLNLHVLQRETKEKREYIERIKKNV